MKMKKLILLASLFISTICISQNFTKKETVEDLNLLLESIEKYNPALSVYNNNFHESGTEIIYSINKDDVSQLEYFSLVSQIVSLSNEGHFDIGNWSDSFHKGFNDNSYKYLPIAVKVLENRIYIWNDYSSENLLSKGDEILEINGKSASLILDQLEKFIPTDGKIMSNFNRTVSLSFPWMYYFYIDQSESFKLTLSDYKKGEIKNLEIKTLNKKAISLNYEKNYSTLIVEPEEPSIKDLYEFKVEGELAVLKLKSFYYRLAEDFRINPKKLYKELFSKIIDSEVKTLIVDLRNNTGGRKEFSNELLPFILTEKTKGLFRMSESWEGKTKKYKIPKRSKLAFRGKIYVLVNGKTFSEGSVVARLFREYTDATIIGEETGTRYEGFTAGSKQSIFLPNSELRINIPRYHLKFPHSEKQMTNNRGLIPDIRVVYSIKDLVEDRDLEMEYLREILK